MEEEIPWAAECSFEQFFGLRLPIARAGSIWSKPFGFLYFSLINICFLGEARTSHTHTHRKSFGPGHFPPLDNIFSPPFHLFVITFLRKGYPGLGPLSLALLEGFSNHVFFWFRFTAHLDLFFFSFAVMDGNNTGDEEETGASSSLRAPPLFPTPGLHSGRFVLHFFVYGSAALSKREAGILWTGNP